tara:strand:+ start:246 stop:380 length:135 start_codon:yes stop_codon:yes gene_type:complete
MCIVATIIMIIVCIKKKIKNFNKSKKSFSEDNNEADELLDKSLD